MDDRDEYVVKVVGELLIEEELRYTDKNRSAVLFGVVGLLSAGWAVWRALSPNPDPWVWWSLLFGCVVFFSCVVIRIDGAIELHRVKTALKEIGWGDP